LISLEILSQLDLLNATRSKPAVAATRLLGENIRIFALAQLRQAARRGSLGREKNIKHCGRLLALGEQKKSNISELELGARGEMAAFDWSGERQRKTTWKASRAKFHLAMSDADAMTAHQFMTRHPRISAGWTRG
jgi:hypothetical protein